MGKNVQIKVGVVGCGAIAQIIYLPYLKDLGSQFEIKTLCDLSQKLLDSMGEKYGVEPSERYTDFAKFLNSDIDSVFILTEGSHAPFICQALRAEKHVFCEKPLCFTLKEAEEIEQILEETDKIVMVGYMKRYDPGFKRAQTIVKQIKNPRYTHVTVLHPSEQQYFKMHGVVRFDDVSQEVREVLSQEQNSIVTNAVGDIRDNLKYIYQDALLSSIVHNTNVIRAIFGDPLGVVSTHIWPIDSCLPTITTILDYGQEHNLILTWSYLSEVRNYVEEFSVYSDSDRLKIKFSSPFLKNVPTNVSHEYMENGSLTSKDINVSFENAFKEELRVFYDSVLTNQSPPTDVADAKGDIKLLQAILAANKPQGLGGEAKETILIPQEV